VVKAVLGERFEGVLGSDFLASYNIHEGLHQRGSGAFLTRPPRAQRAVSRGRRCASLGPRTSKRSMTGPSPTQVPIRACLRPSRWPHGARNSAPSSRSCGSSVRPMRTHPHPCILCISPRLPHSLHPTSVDQNAEASAPSPSLLTDECSDGSLVKSISTFLESTSCSMNHIWAARIISHHRSFLLSINIVRLCGQTRGSSTQ
jgi:hypothetical protein